MRIQHARPVSRRRFLGELTVGGTVGLLALRLHPVAAEPPLETTRLRLTQTPAACLAPQYVAEEFLRGEGFTDVQYVKTTGGLGLRRLWPLARPISVRYSPGRS